MKTNIIVDLDGTLADLTHRLHHIKTMPKNWEAFHAECIDDLPKEDIIQLVNTLADTCMYTIHIVSGRNMAAYDSTIEWLSRYLAHYHSLSMRAIGDRRDDVLVKKDMIKALGLTPENTLFCLDDRQRVVDMWRELGFTCLQVAQWAE